MTDDNPLFYIDPELADFFKAEGYTFNEHNIQARQVGEVVDLSTGVTQDAGSAKHYGKLYINKDMVSIGHIKLGKTYHRSYADLDMDNGNTIHNSLMDDSDAMIRFVRQRFEAGDITAEEAGCYFVALAGYSLARANENAAPTRKIDQELARIEGAYVVPIDTSPERINAGAYANAAKACLKEKDVPKHSGDAHRMLNSEPTTNIDGLIINVDEEPLAQKGIDIDAFTR